MHREGGPQRGGAPAAARLRAFTLIELLVVIAIIAVLMAIILPVVASARRRSNMAVDISNMRQLATAIALYRDDHGYAPYLLHSLDGVYVTSQELYFSPVDPTLPYGWMACFGPTAYGHDPSVDLSFTLGGLGTYVYWKGCGETPDSGEAMVAPDLYARSVEEPGWGILACPTYLSHHKMGSGSVWTTNPQGRRVQVPWIEWYEGTLLRVAADGSLRRVRWRRSQSDTYPIAYLRGSVVMP